MIKKIVFIICLVLNLSAYDKIVALSPSINEIIYALGSGDKIVANTTFCNYPKEAQKKLKVGGYFAPSLEKIISVKPDLVIMQNSALKLSKKLNSLKIENRVVKIDSLSSIKSTILDIGEWLNKSQKAKEIVTQIDKELNSLKDIIKDKKILIVIGQPIKLDKRVFVVGQNLYFNDIIEVSGNKNAYSSNFSGQPILNMENLIATKADIVIILASLMKKRGITKEELIKPWLKLPINASKNRDIYVVGEEYAGIPSDRLIYFLKDFKRFLENVKVK